MNNVIIVTLSRRVTARSTPLFQYDYGQKLQFRGVNLPTVYEVHFSNQDSIGTAKVQIGNADGVIIPDEYLLSGKPIYVWIFLHTALNDGETEYKCIIPINKRAQKEDVEPTPVQQDIITQAIAALNTAVESTSADADSAMASQMMAAQSEQKAKASEQAAAQSESNAARSASNALVSERAAATSEANARQSEHNASASEGAAGLSQTRAATSAAEALASQTAAANSAAAALTSQQEANASENKAALSASNASASEAMTVRMASTATVKAAEADASAIEAEASRQAIENLSVLVETLEPYSQATVTKTVDEHGRVTLTFSIPQGIPGGAVFN